MHSRVIFKNLSGTFIVCFYVKVFDSFGIYFGISRGHVFSSVIFLQIVSQLNQCQLKSNPSFSHCSECHVSHILNSHLYIISDFYSILLICLCIPMLVLAYLNFLCFIVYFNIWVRPGPSFYPLSTIIFLSILTWLFFHKKIRSHRTQSTLPPKIILLFYWDQIIL